jgi:hypothetical protein
MNDAENLVDLKSAIEALKKAQTALEFSLVHYGPKSRDAFIFNVGFARGRLSRIASRIKGEPVPPLSEDAAVESAP